MTDQTNDTGAQLTAIETQLAKLQSIDIQDIGAQLGAIYAEAEQRGDADTVSRAGWLWDVAQIQAQAVDSARAVAATATQIGRAAIQQRDAAIEEYADIRRAAEQWNQNHPIIGGLIESVEASTFEMLVSEFAICSNEPGEDLINGVFEDLCQDLDPQSLQHAHDACDAFARLIFTPHTERHSTPLRRQVFEFILGLYTDHLRQQ